MQICRGCKNSLGKKTLGSKKFASKICWGVQIDFVKKTLFGFINRQPEKNIGPKILAPKHLG